MGFSYQGSIRPWRTSQILLQQPRRLILAAVLFLCVIYLIVKASRGPVTPGPLPVYCSTWDSATFIFPELRGSYLDDYSKWTQYDMDAIPHLRGKQEPSRAVTQPSVLDRLSSFYADRPKSVAGSPWTKPKGFKIVAMIFFGRPHQVDILDCYLQQNMARHGGFLDEVHFVAHTTDERDLLWLDNLVASTPDYQRLDVGPHCTEHPHSQDCRYERIWEHFATDSSTLYIKIDDDMIYIHPETIPRIVQKRLDYTQPFAISANLINSPATSWLHYHTGAIYPYLPEPYPLSRSENSPTWRASKLPLHPKDASYQDFDFEPTPDDSINNSLIEDDEALYREFDLPPFPGHRWLPLSQNTTSLLATPISRGTAAPWGPSVHSWAIAAQQHYSLLQNIENGSLHKYWVAPVPPQGDGLWNQQYTRYNLNFIAVWGRDIVAGANVHQTTDKDHDTDIFQTEVVISSNLFDDEKNITVDMPRALGRPMVIDVQALAAHMHFHDQEVGMQMTDLLDRWRAYVNENVCAANRQKHVPGQVGGLGWTEENGGAGWWQCPWLT